METLIALVDLTERDWADLTGRLTDSGFAVRRAGTLVELAELIKDSAGRFALLDLDVCAADNRFFRDLQRSSPHATIFALSARSFHPELGAAMSSHICACFRKPLDQEELLYWLKAVSPRPRARDPAAGSDRGCP